MSSLEQIIGHLESSSQYQFIYYIVWHGVFYHYPARCNPDFVISLFGQRTFDQLYQAGSIDLSRERLPILLGILRRKYPGILEIRRTPMFLTPLLSACVNARACLAHSLLDVGVDATGACDALREEYTYKTKTVEYDALMKKIIRRGGWFEYDAPAKYVLYRKQYVTAVTLLGIRKWKKSRWLFNDVPYDLIKYMAKQLFTMTELVDPQKTKRMK